MIKVQINTDNDAFKSPNEAARILRLLAHRIENGEAGTLKIRDINGNTVGEAIVGAVQL